MMRAWTTSNLSTDDLALVLVSEAQRDFEGFGIKMPTRYSVGKHRLLDAAGNVVNLDVRSAGEILDFSLRRDADGLAVDRWMLGRNDSDISRCFPQSVEQAGCAARWMAAETGLEITGDMVLEAEVFEDEVLDPDSFAEWLVPPDGCVLRVHEAAGMLHAEAETAAGIFHWPTCRIERKAPQQNTPPKPPEISKASATTMPKTSPQATAKTPPAYDSAGRIAYRRASDIEAKPIHWLWQGRIARGKVSMLAGNPGLGKSQITASMAAVVTTGGIWPVDGSRCQRGNVVFLSAEDDAADTIRPRLESAGADLMRVFILDAVVEAFNAEGDEIKRAFNLKTDLTRLGAMLDEIGGAAMIVIDPITAYLGEADSHKNAEYGRCCRLFQTWPQNMARLLFVSRT